MNEHKSKKQIIGTMYSIAKKIKNILLAIVINFAAIVYVFNFFYNIWVTPDLRYIKGENKETFVCDLELKDAVLYVHPQMLLTKENQIICMIDLKEFCNEYVVSYNQEKKEFEFEGTKWDTAILYGYEIKERLEASHEDICIENAYLLKLEYKKQFGKEGVGYYIVEAGKTPYQVSEEIILERGQEADLSLKNLQMDMEKIVSNCERVLKQM